MRAQISWPVRIDPCPRRADTAVSGTALANRRDLCVWRRRVEAHDFRQPRPATSAARPPVKPFHPFGRFSSSRVRITLRSAKQERRTNGIATNRNVLARLILINTLATIRMEWDDRRRRNKRSAKRPLTIGCRARGVRMGRDGIGPK